MQTLKYPMNLAIAIVAGIMLVGCETLPTSTYTTAAGCGLAQWSKEFIQNNVSTMTWTGPCQNGLAHGKGALTMNLNSGKQFVYSGEMEKGVITGTGVRTSETGWRYEGTFLRNLFIAGKIYLPSGRLLFDGLMAHNEEFEGKNLTFSNQRYKSGAIYFSESTYVTDGRYTGSAGPYLGLDGIDPKSGKGIIYGKYIQDNKTVYRLVEGKLYPDDISYLNAQTKYYENVIAKQNSQIAAYNKEQEARKANELRGAISMLSGALTAAAGGNTRAEQRQLALTALAESTGGSGGAIAGGSTVGATEVVQLSPPGNAKSRNECLKLTWATSPLPIPKRWEGLEKHYRDKEVLRNPDYFGRSSNGNRAEQKHLVATNACTEDLIVTVFSCAEHRMLSAGSAPIQSSQRGDKYSWSADAHTATGFNGLGGLNFTTSDPTNRDWIDLHIARELVIKNQFGSSLYDARRHIVKVFYGAWLRSDITNEKSHGPNSNINLWTESSLKTLTANGKELARKQEAVNKKGREVFGKDQDPKGDHEKRNYPVFSGGGDGGGETIGQPAPSPSWFKLGVKTCAAFTAAEVWNAAR